MARQLWTKEEIAALERIVKLNQCNTETYRKVFPYRTNHSVEQKVSALRRQDPDKWTPQINPPINWDHIEVLEKEAEKCENSPSSTVPTLEVVSR